MKKEKNSVFNEYKKQIKEAPPINLDTKDNKEYKENDMELPKEKIKK